jgi:hypothetical protein
VLILVVKRACSVPSSEVFYRETIIAAGVAMQRLKPSELLVKLELAIGFCAGALGLLTIFWHDWIEALFGWDPDRHNGGAEWVIALGLLTLAGTMGILARCHWRQLAATGNQ